MHWRVTLMSSLVVCFGFVWVQVVSAGSYSKTDSSALLVYDPADQDSGDAWGNKQATFNGAPAAASATLTLYVMSDDGNAHTQTGGGAGYSASGGKKYTISWSGPGGEPGGKYTTSAAAHGTISVTGNASTSACLLVNETASGTVNGSGSGSGHGASASTNGVGGSVHAFNSSTYSGSISVSPTGDSNVTASVDEAPSSPPIGVLAQTSSWELTWNKSICSTTIDGNTHSAHVSATVSGSVSAKGCASAHAEADVDISVDSTISTNTVGTVSALVPCEGCPS